MKKNITINYRSVENCTTIVYDVELFLESLVIFASTS